MDIDQFLSLGKDEIAKIAPKTIVYAPAGTRRRSVLENVSLENYSSWAIRKLADSVGLLFSYGIKHIIVPTLGPGQLNEPDPLYRSKIVDWVAEQASSALMREKSKEHDYRLYLMGPAAKSNQILSDVSEELRSRPYDLNKPALWMYVVQSDDEPWREVLETAILHRTFEREDIARILYQEDIPPVELYIGFGKFALHPRIVPLILFDKDIQCYWNTKAGFDISDDAVRMILYDFIFARSRDVKRHSRYHYDDVARLREFWDVEKIAGIGNNIGGFWIPK